MIFQRARYLALLGRLEERQFQVHLTLCNKVAIMKWFYVYILKSEKDNKFYTGYTSDLKRRIDEHNSGISFRRLVGVRVN